MLASGTMVQGRYRVEKRLGGGGAADVYLVVDRGSGERYALKVLRIQGCAPDEVAMLRRQMESEARILAPLRHRNLARVLDCFEEFGVPCVLMEYIEGSDLGQEEGRPMPEERVMDVATQLLDVLEYLHGQVPPVIVRDLKPLNIMVDHAGRIRLIDFGIAKHAPVGTQTATIIRGHGTPGFAPLEQYGAARTDPRTDLYALGATILCLLTGELPPDASMRVACHCPLPDPREVNPTATERTFRAVEALMEIRPDRRPASASEARGLLFG